MSVDGVDFSFPLDVEKTSICVSDGMSIPIEATLAQIFQMKTTMMIKHPEK